MEVQGVAARRDLDRLGDLGEGQVIDQLPVIVDQTVFIRIEDPSNLGG